MGFATTCSKLREQDSHWRTKAALRGFTTVFSLIAIACFSAAIQLRRVHRGEFFVYSQNLDAINLIGLGWVMVWNVVTVIVQVTTKKPIHPGGNVAAELLAWLCLAICGAISTYGLSPFDSTRLRAFPVGKVARIESTGLILTYMVCIAHFVLFIFVCQDTTVYNRQIRVDLMLWKQNLAEQARTADAAALAARTPAYCSRCACSLETSPTSYLHKGSTSSQGLAHYSELQNSHVTELEDKYLVELADRGSVAPSPMGSTRRVGNKR
ncbi:MAG: hypothetical protein M1817_002186 [Caeruleum heppii]|nr:MAG: hypothetical protein M1817_002186 [Caeruleum heppii]